MAEKIIVIIDFDNYFDSDISTITSEKLEFSFTEIVEICNNNFTEFSSIEIRLYGGWYMGTALTKQASTLQQLLYNVNVFPVIREKKIVRGHINLISEMHGVPNFRWDHTYKETEGMRPVRINFECIDELCKNNREQCPKFILNKFTKKKDKLCAIQNCSNLHKNTFKGIEQKMVDTMIACDIISITDDNTVKGLLIISDDQDLYPSIALANENQKYKYIKNLEKIILGVKNRQKIEFVSNFLRPFQIQTTLLS